MAVKRLNINVIEDFYLWGLLAPVGGHRVCWELNRAFGFDLTRQDDIVLERRPSADDTYFNFYNFDDPVSCLRIELIRNKCSGEFYSRELRQFDYLLMVKGEIDFFETAPFTALLKKLPCVQSALEIAQEKIKYPEILILE